MPRTSMLATLVAAGATVWAADAVSVNVHRPVSSTWARTQCGSPSGTHPAIPAGPYQENWDMPGNDMKPCGSSGCILNKTADHLTCEAMCNSTQGCHAYVFADLSCDHEAGPICWTKSVGTTGRKSSCRNSRVLGQPASTGADIPSKWAAEVNASTTPLKLYPRPQMVRGGTDRDHGVASTWTNLNGLWEWQPADSVANPPFGQTLNSSILVPFPVESCLSGVAPGSVAEHVQSMWYRLVFDVTDDGVSTTGQTTLLHFGAVDWESSVFLNGVEIGNHTGGYDGFDFDITQGLKTTGNELLVFVFDPSDQGAQPNGKQRISAIDSPGGDTYTPSSGIWQTVWLESVPSSAYIVNFTLNQASTSQIVVSAAVSAALNDVTYEVLDDDGKTVLAKGTGAANSDVTINIPSPKLWSPTSPHLYDLRITAGSDVIYAYFGLRTFELGAGGKGGMRPLLNGKFTFLAGFLDQSFWPDGQYTAPTDEALAYDVEAVPSFGLNMIRLHQKVNPERWYYHADRIGVIVFQDMVQKYGRATADTIPLFVNDLQKMIDGRKNHPCIVQFTTFNEGDCWEVFEKSSTMKVADVVALAQQLAPTHLVDTDSGGGANNMHIADVNDIHSYPYPGDPQPSATQYAMVGEFGGIGAFVAGKEWVPQKCHTYLHVDTPTEEASTYIGMAATLQNRSDHISASVYTQTTDVELECDGFLNYDRSNKFSAADTAKIKAANQALTSSQ